MAKSGKMKVGMIGVAQFGKYRRDRMRETGLFEIVAAFNRTREKLEIAMKEEGCAGADSYEELLAWPGIEAMVISTGAKFHAEHTIKALEHGLHVFVEKPMCCTMEEVRQIMHMQKKTGLVIGTGHNDHSCEAESMAIKAMIDRGELGKIVSIEDTTAHSGGMQIKPGDWRGDPDKNPGGMLFQCGVHSLHEMMFYFGPIREVSCMMRYDVHTTPTADAACCILRFESGVIGTLNAYHVTPYRHTFNIYGTKTNIYRDARFFDEGTTWLTQTTKLDGLKEPKVPLKVAGKSDDHGNLRSFYNAVRNGGTPYPSHVDGALAVSVVFAAEESAKQGGKPVAVEIW